MRSRLWHFVRRRPVGVSLALVYVFAIALAIPLTFRGGAANASERVAMVAASSASDRATGGGQIEPATGVISSFGFNGRRPTGFTGDQAIGRIEFNDHTQNGNQVNVPVTTMTITANQAQLLGDCGSGSCPSGVAYVFVNAIDNGEPNQGSDTFTITYCAPGDGSPPASPGVCTAGSETGNVFHGNIQVSAQTLSAQNAVSAGGNGIYPTGATYSGVYLSGGRIGDGVVVNSDGSANGVFDAVLIGITALGVDTKVIVVGDAASGSLNGGTLTVNGTASVDLGLGAGPTQGVAFTAAFTTSGVAITLGGSALPSLNKTAGFITIE